jgi:hypothetical protein
MELESVPPKPNLILSIARWIGGGSGPRRLLALILTVALVAYAWTGIFYTPKPTGQSTTPFIVTVLFQEPWALFVFYAFVMLALEASILMDPDLPRPWRPSLRRVTATLTFTFILVIAVSLGYLARDVILSTAPQVLRDLIALLTSWLTYLGAHKSVVFTVSDLAGLIILWLGIHYASYDPGEITGGPPAHAGRRRIAGDLLLSACFSFLLAWVFFWPFWSINFAQAAQKGAPTSQPPPDFTVCDLSIVHLPCITPPWSWTSLFFADALIIPLLCVAGAIAILLYEALVVATERHKVDEYPDVILDTIVDVVRRRFTWPNLLMALRYFWPFLLIGATILTALAAARQSLYLYSAASGSNAHIFFIARPSLLGMEFEAAIAALLAMAMVVTATTLQVVPHARRDLTLHREMALGSHHIRFLAFLFAQAYCGFALFLTFSNWLVLIVVYVINQTPGHTIPMWYPFLLLDPLMLISLTIFAVFAVRRWRIRRSKRGQQLQG